MQYSNVGRSPSPPGTGTGTTMTMTPTPTTAALGQQHSVAQFPASTGASIIGRSPNANTIALDSVDISRLRYSLLGTLPISIGLLSSIICFIVGPTGTTKSRNNDDDDDDDDSTTPVSDSREFRESRSRTLAAVFAVFFIIMIPFILITIVLLALLRKINARNKCLFTTYIVLGNLAAFVMIIYFNPGIKLLVDGWNMPNIKPYRALISSIFVQGIFFIIAGIYAESVVYRVRQKLVMRLQGQMNIQLGSIMTQSHIVPQYPVAAGAGGTGTGTTSTPSTYYNNNTNAYPPQEQPA